MSKNFNTEIEFRKMVKSLDDGVILDDQFADRNDGIEIADFFLSNSGLAIELKCVEGAFVTESRFRTRLDQTLKKFGLPESAVEEIIFDQSYSLSKPKKYFWSYLARPAEKLARKASKQIKSTRLLVGNDVKYGALFVAVDGAGEASIGQIANLFFYILSRKYFEDLDAAVIFSSKQIYHSESGGLKSFWVPGYASEEAYAIGNEIDRIGRLWGDALERAHGVPFSKEFLVDAKEFDFGAKPVGRLD